MGVINVGPKLKLNHDLFRVTKSIHGQKKQEYYRDRQQAHQRQKELDTIAGTKPPGLDHFLHTLTVNPNADSTNVGCRYVSVKWEKSRKEKPFRNAAIAMICGVAQHREHKVFSLNQSGWPEAFHEAVEAAINCYLSIFPKSLSDDDIAFIRSWTKKEQVCDNVLALLYKEAAQYGRQHCHFNTAISINATMRFITCRAESDYVTLYINHKSAPKRNKRVRSFKMLTAYAAYFIAILINRGIFSTNEQQQHYIGGVYFTLISTWRYMLSSDDKHTLITPDEFNRHIESFLTQPEQQ